MRDERGFACSSRPGGWVGVGNAAQIVDFHGRTAPVADPRGPGRQPSTTSPTRPDSSDLEEGARGVRRRAEQISRRADDDELDRGRRDARGVWFAKPNATGMVGLRGVLDPEGAAILKSAIDPLSIPCPEKDEQGRAVRP